MMTSYNNTNSHICYHIVILPSAQTQGSTAMVTVLPPNSEGYITSSFPANDSAKQNIAKIFLQSSKARVPQMEKHSQYGGYYATTQQPNKGFKITPILLSILGLEDTSGTEINIFAATLSNVASEGRVKNYNKNKPPEKYCALAAIPTTGYAHCFLYILCIRYAIASTIPSVVV